MTALGGYVDVSYLAVLVLCGSVSNVATLKYLWFSTNFFSSHFLPRRACRCTPAFPWSAGSVVDGYVDISYSAVMVLCGSVSNVATLKYLCFSIKFFSSHFLPRRASRCTPAFPWSAGSVVDGYVDISYSAVMVLCGSVSNVVTLKYLCFSTKFFSSHFFPRRASRCTPAFPWSAGSVVDGYVDISYSAVMVLFEYCFQCCYT